MIVQVKSGLNGAKAKVVRGHVEFVGRQATGASPQQAIGRLAREVKRAGYRGKIVVWR